MNFHPKNAPLFFLSIAFLIGVGAFGFYPNRTIWIFSLPLIFLLFLAEKKRTTLFFFVLGFAYTAMMTPTFPTSCEGEGIFKLHKICPITTPFGKGTCLKGKLSYFQTQDQEYKNLPCTLFVKQIPKSARSYLVKGTWNDGILKPAKDCLFYPVDKQFSLPHKRYFWKNAAIKNRWQTTSPQVRDFFSSLLSGDKTSLLLKHQFETLGLSHILAISGLHFSLIAFLLYTLLNLFFSKKTTCQSLLVILLAYLIFLGPSPSILRAFLMICLYLGGKLLNRVVNPLNILGFALLFELVFSPASIEQASFQLTFGATTGILLFYQPIQKALTKFLPQRSMSQLRQLPIIQKHLVLALALIRSNLALNGAVYFLTLPLILYHFQSFSLLSIPYNLLITPLLSLSIFLLPLGLICPPIDWVNQWYTGKILHLITHHPTKLNNEIFIDSLSAPLIIAFVSLLLFIQIKISIQKNQKIL